MANEAKFPESLVRFCGADCSPCDTYKHLLAGDESGLVNPETKYRCCWLPKDYPEGIDCPFRICCEDKGIRFCGQCAQLEGCVRIAEFYSQPGYGVLRQRMLEEVAKRQAAPKR